MDSDDEVIPAGLAGDNSDVELDDLLDEQPAKEEAQAPRLGRLKRKVVAGDDAPVKARKRSSVLDSPEDTEQARPTETETPSPGGDEKSTRRGDSDAGDAAGGDDGEEEVQAAQSGEESGDAEGSDKSDSDGEEGNEEVNEEEVLEKFIDEGGKLSDLESDSEGAAPEIGVDALLAVLPKKRTKDKLSKKEKERIMADQQRFLRASAQGARFEGAGFEKKDLGGVLAKFKARFEELPAPPPKDVVRRRGSTVRPQPIAVSLEELEDMIGEEGAGEDEEVVVVKEGSDKEGDEDASENESEEEMEDGHLSLRMASTQEEDMLASPSPAGAEEEEGLGLGNEEDEEEEGEDGEGGSGSDADGDDEAEEAEEGEEDDEDGSGSESGDGEGSEGAEAAANGADADAEAADAPAEEEAEEEEELSPEERAALAQKRKQSLIDQLIRESKRKERRPAAAGQGGFLEEEAEMSEDGGHTDDDEDDAEEDAKIRRELEELLDGDENPEGEEDQEARARAHALWEAAQDRKEMNHLVQAIKNGFKRTGNRGVMGDDDDDGEMQRRRRRNGDGEEDDEDEDADGAVVRNPFMAALEAADEDEADDGIGTQRMRARRALDTAEAAALTEALQDATDKDLLKVLTKRKAEAPPPPAAAGAAGADRLKKPEHIRPPGMSGFLGRAASVRESSQNILKKAGDMSLGGGGRSFVFGRDESNSAFPPEDRGASRAGVPESKAGFPAQAGAPSRQAPAPRTGSAPAAAAPRPGFLAGGSQGSQGSSLFGLLRGKPSQDGGGSFLSEDCKALAAGLRKATAAQIKPGPGVLAAYNRSEAARRAAGN